AGKRTAAEAACAELRRPLLVADAVEEARSDTAPATTALLLRREAQLQGAGLYVTRLDELSRQDERARALADALARELPGELLVLVGLEGAPELDRAPFALAPRIELALPDVPSRMRLWREALGVDSDG